jgi:hypothetical protein
MIVKDSFRKSASVEISGADEQNCFGHLLAYFENGWNAMCGRADPSSWNVFQLRASLASEGEPLAAPANGP